MLVMLMLLLILLMLMLMLMMLLLMLLLLLSCLDFFKDQSVVENSFLCDKETGSMAAFNGLESVPRSYLLVVCIVNNHCRAFKFIIK